MIFQNGVLYKDTCFLYFSDFIELKIINKSKIERQTIKETKKNTKDVIVCVW